MSLVSGKKEIPVLTVNSSEGEEENTSFLCSQNSEKEEDFIILRQRAIRKLKHLVDKCCMKRIKFSQNILTLANGLQVIQALSPMLNSWNYGLNA